MTNTLLKELRINKGLSEEKVAEKLNISIAEYIEIELNSQLITFEYAGKLGDILNIDPKRLLENVNSVNYNLGTYSRTIYATNYYESAERDEKER